MNTTAAVTPAPPTSSKVFGFLQQFLNDATIAEQVAIAFPPIAPEAEIAQMITLGIQKLLTLHVAVTSQELDVTTLQLQPEIPLPKVEAPAKA